MNAPEKKPRRKKRKPKKASEVDDRPLFARNFPTDPALAALLGAFERGDYAHVRREAPLLAKSTSDEEVRAAARELRRRIDPDFVSVFLLGVAVVLLVALAAHYFAHRHVPV